MANETSEITTERVFAALTAMGLHGIEVDADGELDFILRCPEADAPIAVTVAPTACYLRVQATLLTTYDVELLPLLYATILRLQCETPTAKGLTFVADRDGRDRAHVNAVVVLPVRLGGTDEQVHDWAVYGIQSVLEFIVAVDAAMPSSPEMRDDLPS
ncbi:MAG: hypothetical protein JO222_04260, partial [Frankiales bacterium]|nr:hypothetical protein [Frankiales bacterium]